MTNLSEMNIYENIRTTVAGGLAGLYYAMKIFRLNGLI